MSASHRIQLHVVLPYRFEPREHHRIRGWLDRGYRIADLQRVTDREVLVTLEAPLPPPESKGDNPAA